MNIVETKELTKIYEARQIALNGVSMTVPQGCIYGLIGPNGAGKSTALRLILGLQKPTAGDVTVFGEPMSMQSGDLRQRIGFLAQTGRFPPDMTPITYLDLVGRLFGIGEIRKPRLSSLLHAMDLLQASSQRIEHLSSGQRTRLGIAAALMNEPDLLILDEPTIGLDPEGANQTIALMNGLRSQGKTIILSTHVLPDADQVCDYVGILHHGKLIFGGTVGQMKDLADMNAVDLAVEGDLDSALKTLVDGIPGVRFDRLTSDSVRVSFNHGGNFSVWLGRVMEEFARHEVKLLSIRQAGELEEAFLKRLAEDKYRGFSRAFGGSGVSTIAEEPPTPDKQERGATE